jgi:hypothetical protein
MPTQQRQAVEGYLAWKWSIQASISSFSPIYISGCMLWLDAQDLTTMFQTTAGTSPVTAATQSVGLWRDKSGNGYNALVSNPSGSPTATFPTYQTTTGPAVYFANSADMMFFSNFFTGTSGYDIFVVGQPLPSTAPNYRTLLRGSTSEYPIIINSGGTQIGAYLNTGGFNQFGGASGLTWPDNSLQLLYVTISSTNIYNAALNGTSSLSAAANAGVNNNFAYFGNYQGGAQPWGYVNELIILSNVTPTQRALIETYLSRKWGKTVSTTVTNAHPYTSIKPFTRQFSPLDIPGCMIWLDGADTSIMTPSNPSSGTTITAWQDKAGLMYSSGTTPYSFTPGAIQTASSNGTVYTEAGPTYVTGGGVLFTNSTSALSNGQQGLGLYSSALNSSPLFTIPTQAMTIVVASLPVTNTGLRRIALLGSYQIGAAYLPNFFIGPEMGVSEGGTLAFDYNGSAWAQYNSSTSGYNSTAALRVDVMISSQGASQWWWTNGTLNTFTTSNVYTSTYSNYPVNYFFLGSYTNTTDGNRNFYGTIYEVLLYNIALTTAQRQQIEGYLRQKWKVTLTSHPFTNFPPSSPTIFSPTNFIGCKLWLDSADFASLSLSSSSVTQWNDKSGNGYNAVLSTGCNATSPIYNSSTKAIQFVAANLNVGATSGGTALTIAQGFGNEMVGKTSSLFFVAQRTVATGGAFAYFIAGATTTANQNLLVGIVTTDTMEINEYGAVLDSAITAYSAPDPVRIYGYAMNSTNYTNILNGTVLNTGLSSGTYSLLTAFIQPEIGRRYGASASTAYHTFNLFEVIVFVPALTTTQRQQVEGYLAAKWNIQRSLPITHPYYKYSPSQLSQTSLVTNVSISFSSTTLTSSWGGSPDATSYLFTIYQSSSLTGALSTYSTSTLTSTSYTSTGLPVNYYYRMTVSAIGPGGTTRASVSSSVPCLAAPTSLTNTITGTTLTLNWIGAANASGYSYTLNGGGQVAVGNVVSYTYPTALTPGNSYYYNLYATSSTNSISAISASSATVYCLAQPSAPTLVLTTTAGATTTYSFTLSWSGVTTLATNINYYIGTSTTYNVSNVIQGNSANTGSGSVTLSSASLSSNTLYYAFVQGYSTNTTSTASSASSGTWCLAAPTLNSPTFSPFATYTTQLNWTNNSTSSQGATNILTYIGALSNSSSSTTLTAYSGAVGSGTSVATQFQYVANTVYTFYVKTIGTNTSATSRTLSFAYYNSVAKRSLTISTGYTVTASFSGGGGGGGYGTDGTGALTSGNPGFGAMTSNVTFSVSTGNTINLYIGQAGSNVYGSASGTTTSSAVCGDGTIGGSGGSAYYVAGAYGANGGGAGGGGAATALICSGVAVIVCGGGGGAGNGGAQGGQGGNGGTTANGGIGLDGYTYNGTLINYGHNGGYGGGEGCSVANRTAGWIDSADAKNSLVPYAPSPNQLGWRGTAVYITSITLGADGTSSTGTGTSTTAIGNGGYSGQYYGQAGGGGGGGYSGGGGGLSCNQGSTHNSGGGGGGSSYSSAGGTFVASSGSGAGWAFIGYG